MNVLQIGFAKAFSFIQDSLMGVRVRTANLFDPDSGERKFARGVLVSETATV